MIARAFRGRAALVVVVLATPCVLAFSARAGSTGTNPTQALRPHEPALLWRSVPITQQPATAPLGSSRNGWSWLVVGALVVIIVASGAVVIFGIPSSTRAPVAPRRAGAASEQGDQAETVEHCKVMLWQGDVTSQLTAVERSGSVAAVSDHFRLGDGGAPNAAAHEALAGLLAQLERANWHVVETGPGWHDRRLERTTTGG
jgi:hypothetical protein